MFKATHQLKTKHLLATLMMALFLIPSGINAQTTAPQTDESVSINLPAINLPQIRDRIKDNFEDMRNRDEDNLDDDNEEGVEEKNKNTPSSSNNSNSGPSNSINGPNQQTTVPTPEETEEDNDEKDKSEKIIPPVSGTTGNNSSGPKTQPVAPRS
ncbi:MAG TPA: hypothetical protein VD998_04345, partial [Verrucomicrobiae bacterium]|nr:hypothetical protein [Verrucomicrobiae bacterium]